MLKLYNKEHEAIGVLTELKDYKIEYVLSGEDSLEFSLSRYDENIPLIEEECYIRTKHNEYVIKAIEPSDNFKRFTCNINIENLVGKVIKNFDTKNNNITDTIRLAISGTGWILADNDITKRRTVTLKNTNALEVLRKVREAFRVDFRFDAINKIIYVYEKLGSDKGVYFTDELNLISLDVPSDSYDYATRLYVRGKNGITFADINNGKDYIENFQYSNKIIETIWEDNRYTDVNSLKEDAEAKLEELSKPRRNYNVQVYDLAKNNSEFSFLDFNIGDTVTIISNLEKFKDKQRIVKYIEYPDDSSKNTCELGNTTLTFEELQKENEAKNDTVDAITSDNGTIDGSKVDSITTEQISDFEAEVAKITDLTVINADITNLKAENVTITGKLNAVEGEFGTLKSNVANIDKLVVNHTAEINNLIANKADITDLTATNIKFDVASGGTLDLQTLLSKFVTGENGQFINISSSNSVIANATIKNAMIESLSVDKLLAGRISTNKFTVSSDDGGIEIVGATQQFKDKNNKVRIQMGQDTHGNFNFILRGEDGTTTLIDHTGIKENAIGDDLIKGNMVAADAIGEKQINYSSLITGLNKDTNTQLIKASKVAIDLTGQSLEVSFNSLKSNVDNIQIGGRNLWKFTKEYDGTKYTGWVDNNNATREAVAPYTIINGFGVQRITSAWIDRSQRVTIEPNTNYTLSAWIKWENTAGTMYFYTNTGTMSGTNVTTQVGTSNYKRVSVTFNSGNSNISTCRFECSTNTPYLIYGLKLEKGNKATDWSPALEDVDYKIESNTTAITVAQGKIEGLISENSIIKGDVTTISDKYTSLKATVDGINTTVASHTSSIGTINTNISGLSGKVTSVENKYSTLSQDLSSFKTTVGNTYSTKSELSTVDGKVTSLSSRVGTAESSITQLNNKIALKVEATDVTNAINNIQIGGRNLLSQSDSFNKGGGSTGITSVLNSDGTLSVTASSGNGNWFTSWAKSYGVVENNMSEGDIFTISFTMKSANTTLKPSIYIKNGMGYYSMKGTMSSNWSTIYYTGTWKKANGMAVHLGFNGIVGTIDIKNWKIEKGNKPTEWTAAPEDINSAISTVDNKVTTTNNKVATIETNLNGITQRVSSTESTVSTHTTQLGTVDSRINTAKNSAISTAASDATSKANTAQTNATNAAKSYTDGQITTINKTITDKVAEIKTTTDSITSRVSKAEQVASSSLQGKMLYTDPTFKSGNNSINPYNNAGGGTVTVSRVAKSSDCPTTSGYMLQIKTTGTASPGHGGFYFGTGTRANAILITKIIAKIPSGCTLNWASNGYGTGGKQEWLTSTAGTGNWQEYICKVTCGTSGTFSSTNFFYLSGGITPVTWYVAMATVFDITDTSNIESRLSTAEQKITDSAIIFTVSSQFYKKTESDNKYLTSSSSTITQLSNQISSKVDVNGVKTVIQQNPESVKIGFNNISDSFLINEHGLLCNNINGNKSIAIQKGNLYYYNQYDNSKFLGGIIPRITTSDYLKGFGVLASKHCNTFQISHTDQWDNDSQWEIPGTIYPDFWINYKDITSYRGDLKGIHLGMTTYADNNILGNQSNSISGFNSISATSMCYDHWRSLVDNSIVARFDGGTNKILLGKNLNGNGFVLENFASVNASKIYLDNVYAYNGNYGKILFRTDGWNMYNGVNWDWQGYNILSPKIIGGSYGYSATLSSTRSYKTSIDTSSILDCINIVEPINTYSKSSNSSLEMDISQLINHPNADMFIDRKTNNIDMKSMLHLALLEIQKLKKEVQEIRAS